MKTLAIMCVLTLLVAGLVLVVASCLMQGPTESDKNMVVLVRDTNGDPVVSYRYRDYRADRPLQMAIIRVDGTAQFEAELAPGGSFGKPVITVPVKQSVPGTASSIEIVPGQLWSCRDASVYLAIVCVEMETVQFLICTYAGEGILAGRASADELRETLEGFEL